MLHSKVMVVMSMKFTNLHSKIEEILQGYSGSFFPQNDVFGFNLATIHPNSLYIYISF